MDTELKRQLDLIKGGQLEIYNSISDDLDFSDVTNVMVEGAMDIFSSESQTQLIEASLNVFDKIGMKIFDKFNKLDKLISEDINKFAELKNAVKGSEKEIHYSSDVDINNLIKTAQLMIDIYDNSVSGKKIVEILSKPDVKAGQFLHDEQMLYNMMDKDIENFKRLMKQLSIYKKIKETYYVISSGNVSDVDKYVKTKHTMLDNLNKLRNMMKDRIDEYSKSISTLENKGVVGFKSRLTKLTMRALNNAIFMLNQITKVYITIYDAEKHIYNQISRQVK